MRTPAALALLSALALSACETPREACLSAASRDLRVVEQLIRQTRVNLERGYAVEEEQVVDVRRDFCTYEREDGTEGRRLCERTVVEDVEVPVAIDLRAERVKLGGLLERRAQLRAQEAARRQACLATYPE